jgi:immune inhibitor A
MKVNWLLVLVLVGALIAPLAPHAHAQDGKRADDTMSWADAPLAPLHRSEADWLLDVGWKSFQEVYGPFFTRVYEVGETEQLIPLGLGDIGPTTFHLRYRSEHAYFWFEAGTVVDPGKLESAARFFEEHIWPLNNAIYGDEWNPGIDGDSRLHIVNQRSIALSIAGAFNPEDQCPRSLCPSSNQREIIYINLEIAPLNSSLYLGTLAHEHQHLIQHHVDGNESRWFNEGLSQLAEHLNGFEPMEISGGNLRDFLRNPDHPLNGWASDIWSLGEYYGASYLFLVYLYERFGLDFIRQVARNPYDGLAGVERTLADSGQTVSVDDVFVDWSLANYLDDPRVGDGRYYYQSLDIPARIQPLVFDLGQGSAHYTTTVNQYGTDYVRLGPAGTYDFSFDGSDQAPVIGTHPYLGNWMWWSYNDMSSAARLTGAFDLTGLDTATLAFRVWWSMEEEDWFQVLVSDSGGQDWQIVGGPHAISADAGTPGAHYSGKDGEWIAEQIDLSAYTGKQVLIRFEYLTDGFLTLDGVALDQIEIVELGYTDGAESPHSLWNPEGFVRVPAQVAQQWAVTLVVEPPDGAPTVQPLVVDAGNTTGAHVTIPEGGTATLVIAAMAPFSTQPASYKLSVQRAD